MEAKDLLKDLVSYNTIRDKENKKIMDYLDNYLKGYGFTIERVGECLIAYNSLKPNIGFIGHTDVVDYESWDGDSFCLQEVDNKLIGLGACDMKGGISAILSCISKIDLDKNKLALYFTYDEEKSLTGIQSIKDMVVPDNIIIGEPTDNVPIYGTKGLLEFNISFKGIKCHSSTPNKGKSAILDCVSFINEINKYYNTILKKELVLDFEIPYTTMNIGLINGGESENSVPEKCSIIIDFRIVKKEHINKIKKQVNKLLTKYDSKFITNFEVPPNINNNDISFLEEISSKKETKCYLTEGSYINKNFIILGPGPDTSHQKNEYITIDSLNKTVELYKKIIEYYNKKSI